MDNRKEKTGPLKRMAIRIALGRMAKKLKTYLKDSEMKDWKTTIAGAVLAAVVAVQPIVESGIIDWKDLAFAAFNCRLRLPGRGQTNNRDKSKINRTGILN